VEPHPAGQLDDRGAVTDGRHDALVAVAERDGGLPAGQPADLAGGMLAHLQGRLGELRQRLVLDDCHVADREDVAMPGDPEVGAGADTAAGGLRQAPAGDGGRGRHPRRPHGDITGQGGAVGQQDPVGRDLGDGGVEMDVDAALDQLLAGIFTQRRVERCQQFRRLLDQGDVHPRPVDLRIGRGERDVAQVGETAGQFDAGRAAADDGHPDIPAQAGEADPFQARHEPVTQDDGVLPGVQAQGVLGRAGNAVIRGGHAGGQDEVVVAQPCPIGQHDLPGRGLDGGKFAVPEHRAVPSADGAGKPRRCRLCRRWPPRTAAAGRCCRCCGRSAWSASRTGQACAPRPGRRTRRRPPAPVPPRPRPAAAPAVWPPSSDLHCRRHITPVG
jgi:hypothetical protein